MPTTEYMEACRRLVEPFYLKREGYEDYIVRVEFAPNPLNYDGDDEVYASIVKKDTAPSGFQVEKVIRTTHACPTVEEAMSMLGESK